MDSGYCFQICPSSRSIVWCLVAFVRQQQAQWPNQFRADVDVIQISGARSLLLDVPLIHGPTLPTSTSHPKPRPKPRPTPPHWRQPWANKLKCIKCCRSVRFCIFESLKQICFSCKDFDAGLRLASFCYLFRYRQTTVAFSWQQHTRWQNQSHADISGSNL